MSDREDEDAYLQRVSRAAREQFRAGFLTASTVDSTPATHVTLDVHSVVDREPVLPMKKKRAAKRGRDSGDDEDGVGGNEEAPQSQQQQQQSLASQPLASSPAASSGPKRLTLLDKYFPGNLLKNSSLSPALSPPAAFVEQVISQVEAMREQIVVLRSTVEDAEQLLTGQSIADQVGPDGEHLVASADCVDTVVCAENWKGVRKLLKEGLRRRAGSLREQRSQLEKLRQRKEKITVPARHSPKLWQRFISLHGPETGSTLSLSDFLWSSSACTTLLFNVVAQRFLRVVRESETASTSLCRLEVVNDDSLVDDAQEWLSQQQPRLPEDTPADVASLLVFLRCLMPATSLENHLSSVGYGSWLFSCLCALDTPLDPDTDRVAHTLFRACCDHLRTLGTVLGVQGDERGALWTMLERSNAPDASANEYTRVQDVGIVELRALSTLVVVLAKFFRQNQSRLITL